MIKISTLHILDTLALTTIGSFDSSEVPSAEILVDAEVVNLEASIVIETDIFDGLRTTHVLCCEPTSSVGERFCFVRTWYELCRNIHGWVQMNINILNPVKNEIAFQITIKVA